MRGEILREMRRNEWKEVWGGRQRARGVAECSGVDTSARARSFHRSILDSFLMSAQPPTNTLPASTVLGTLGWRVQCCRRMIVGKKYYLQPYLLGRAKYYLWMHAWSTVHWESWQWQWGKLVFSGIYQVPKRTWEYMQIGGSLPMVVCRIYKLVQSVSAWEYFQVKRVEWQSWQKVAAAAIQQQSAASCLTGALPPLIYPNLSNGL